MKSLKNIYAFKNAKTPTFFFDSKHSFSSIGKRHIEFIKKVARDSSKSARICLHKDINSDLHNMIIVHHKGRYIRPHKNPTHSKMYQIMEGRMRIIGIDDSQNKLFDLILGFKNQQVLRIQSNIYLLLLPLTPLVVFCETILGPFNAAGGGQIYAPFSPQDSTNAEIIDAFVRSYTERKGMRD